MNKAYPFIRFNDNKCREAMTFYKKCLGGELQFMVLKDTSMAKDFPPEKQELIMHSSLKFGDNMIIGSDMMRDKAIIGDNVGIALEMESESSLRDLFEKLSNGGEVFMAPEEAFWGGVFGVLTDMFGVEWMMNFQKKPVKM